MFVNTFLSSKALFSVFLFCLGLVGVSFLDKKKRPKVFITAFFVVIISAFSFVFLTPEEKVEAGSLGCVIYFDNIIDGRYVIKEAYWNHGQEKTDLIVKLLKINNENKDKKEDQLLATGREKFPQILLKALYKYNKVEFFLRNRVIDVIDTSYH